MIRIILPERGSDPWGSGAFGASRGERVHKGIDYECLPGSEVLSPVTGNVTKLGYPYADDLSYRYIQISNTYTHRIFYVEPLVKVGDWVTENTVIGICQNITKRYDSRMKNHVHYEVLSGDTPVNPELL